MTPFLVLVLAGFGLFIVVLGFVSTQDFIRRARAARPATRAPSHEAEAAPWSASRAN